MGRTGSRRRPITSTGAVVPLGVLGFHHVAGCIAALCAMVEADARRVTDLVIRTPDNLLRNGATGKWQLKKRLLKEFHPASKRMERRFDSVNWM
jgi:hypothetical protein